MSLIVQNNINSNYIKYKGKLYQKTTATAPDIVNAAAGPEKIYSSLEEGIFDNNLINDATTQLRPKYIGINESTYTPTTVNSGNNSFDVDVVPKNNSHPLFGQGSSSCLSISGYQNLELNLITGKTYYFYQKTSSNIGNRLKVTLNSQGNTNAILPIATYTGTPGVDGALFFAIPLNAPQTYYLSSEGGQFMGIKINVNVYYESLPSSVANFNLLSASNYYALLA